MKKRLLIISCSNAKNKSIRSIPALQLYNGPVFKMIRALQREKRWPEDTKLLILSSKFGLIEPESVIPCYDSFMTPQKAEKLKNQIKVKIEIVVGQFEPSEIFCNLGGIYWACFKDSITDLSIPVVNAKGRIGEKLSKTKRWLLK